MLRGVVEYNSGANCKPVVNKVPKDTVKPEDSNQSKEVVCVPINSVYTLWLSHILQSIQIQ